MYELPYKNQSIFENSKPRISNRTRHQMSSIKESVLRNFTKFTKKRLCYSLFAGLRTPLDECISSKCLLKPKECPKTYI